MEIGLTAKVQKKVAGAKLHAPVEENTFYCWDVNLFKYGTRQALLIVNVKTRLAAVLINLKPRDFKDIEGTVREGIVCVMKQNGYDEAQIRRYFENAGSPELTKTHGRSVMGVINRFMLLTDCCCLDIIDKEARYQSELCAFLNRDIFQAPELEERCTYPYEYFQRCIKGEL